MGSLKITAHQAGKCEEKMTKYTPEFIKQACEQICQMVAAGGNLDKICLLPDLPSKDTVYKWLQQHKNFADDYARAREYRADSRSDRIDDYKLRMLSGEYTPEQIRIAIDAEKWQAGKENPKRYGDRQIHVGDGTADPIGMKHYNDEDEALLDAYVKLKQVNKSTGIS